MLTFAMPRLVGCPRIVIVARAEGNQRERGQGQRQRQKGREDVDELVRSRRRHVLFEKKLDAVCQRLQQSMCADVQRSEPRLNSRDYFSFEPGEIGKRRHQNEQQNDNLDYRYHQDRMLGDELHGISLASLQELSLEQ